MIGGQLPCPPSNRTKIRKKPTRQALTRLFFCCRNKVFEVELDERQENMATRKRQEDNQQGKKIFWYLGLIIVVLFLLWIFFAPGRGYFHYQKLQREITNLTRENSQLAAKNTELSQDIKRLQSDDAYLEEVARKKHGLLKKNETVYEFEAPKKKK